MTASKAMRIAIDARIPDATHGGVQQAIIGLAHGLSALDGPEEYLFLTLQGRDAWLAPHVGGQCRRLASDGVRDLVANVTSGVHRRVREVGNRVRAPLRPIWHAVAPILGPRAVRIPRSDGTVEREDVEVVHFPVQRAFLTHVPSIYHPHDLQHLHLPEFFSQFERLTREVHYRAFCQQAARVAVTSGWVKRDIEVRYGLRPGKVVVVPWAPILDAYARPTQETLVAIQRRFRLPDPFLLYPANFWPHKNHVALLRAVHLVRRSKGLDVGLVFPGRQHGCFEAVRDEAAHLGIESVVRFPGFVTPEEIGALYALCRAVVIPSKFEAASFPLWEAFQAGVPAACSRVTSLPEQANGAALLFAPDQPEEIAAAVERLLTDEALRARLIGAGRSKLARFTWGRTAATFRAHYRAIAGRTLNEKDAHLLTSDPGI